MFTISPLQGAISESSASQSLLELDGGVKVLVDVGWDETFDVEKLRELEKCVRSLSNTTLEPFADRPWPVDKFLHSRSSCSRTQPSRI